jgi:hypothetical protein
MAAPTIPPSSQPTTAPITPSPLGPYISETIDESGTQISAQQKSLQRLIYELNCDLLRAQIWVDTDITVAAQQVLALQGFGTDLDGNYLIEEHVIVLSSSSNALSELTMRKCQNVAALYQIPGGGSGNSAAQPSQDVTSPGGSSIPGAASPAAGGSLVNQGPELQGGGGAP